MVGLVDKGGAWQMDHCSRKEVSNLLYTENRGKDKK